MQWLLVPGVLPLAIVDYYLCRHVTRTAQGPTLFRHAPKMIALVLVAGLLGVSVGLRIAFGAVQSGDPSSRASRLAEGITIAMWSTAASWSTMALLLFALLTVIAARRLRA